MEINIRKSGSKKYIDVNVVLDSVKADLGLMDKEESRQLLMTLLIAASDIVSVMEFDNFDNYEVQQQIDTIVDQI